MDILSKKNNVGVNVGISTNHTVLSENAILVLKAVENNERLTQQHISNDLQVTVRTIQRALKELREKQYIQRIGSDKSGHYKVLKSYLGPDSQKGL